MIINETHKPYKDKCAQGNFCYVCGAVGEALQQPCTGENLAGRRMVDMVQRIQAIDAAGRAAKSSELSELKALGKTISRECTKSAGMVGLGCGLFLLFAGAGTAAALWCIIKAIKWAWLS